MFSTVCFITCTRPICALPNTTPILPVGPRAQLGTFQLDELVAPGVAAADLLGDPDPGSIEAVEIAASTQYQRLLDRPFEVPVVTLDGAVLVRDAGIVADPDHAVVAAQCLVAPGLGAPVSPGRYSRPSTVSALPICPLS